MDWQLTCRVCLETGDMVSLFDWDENNEQLSDKYTYCCGVEVTKSDSFPTLICLNCVDRLTYACQFKQQCLTSNDTLKECLDEFLKSSAAVSGSKSSEGTETETITIKQENGLLLQYELPVEHDPQAQWTRSLIKSPTTTVVTKAPGRRKRGRPRKYPNEQGQIGIMANRRRISPLWNHFDEIIPNKKAKCAYCSRIMAVTASSIGSLSRHLKAIHPTIEINSKRQSAKRAEQAPSCSKVQQAGPTLIDYLQSKKCLSRSRRTQQLDEQLIRMIAKGSHGLNIVDEVEFRKFVEMLNVGYTLPNRKTLSETILPRVYVNIVERVRAQIERAAAVCITTDETVQQGDVAVTAHFIDVETHKLRSVMIGFLELDENITDENLKSLLESKFFEWNIYERINAIVSDDTANILNAVHLGGWHSLTCFAHTLNLVVQSSMDAISDTMRRVKCIIEYFNRSSPAKQKLAKIQAEMNMSRLKPSRKVTKRWNSAYDALQSLLKIKEALIATIASTQPDIALTQEEWSTIENATELLKIFYDVTIEISGEQYIPASKYIVLCKLINRALNKFVPVNDEKIQQLYYSLKAQMQQRFGEVESSTILCEATILDPRFKKSGFTNICNYESSVTNLIFQISSDHTQVPVQQERVQDEPVTQSGTRSIWDDFDKEISVNSNQDSTTSVIVEFNTYIEEPLIKVTDDPLLWWNKHKGSYPRLYNYMLKRLNITATSLPCESAFSKTGLVLRMRTRLKTKKMSELLFISSN